MPVFHGKNGKIFVQDIAGSLRDISGDLNNVTLSWTRDNPTTTTFGMDSESRIAGVRDAQLSLAGVYSPSANVSAASVLQELMTGSAVTLIKWAPGGSISGSPFYTACFLLSQFEAQGPQNGPGGISATFQLASGSLSASTV